MLGFAQRQLAFVVFGIVVFLLLPQSFSVPVADNIESTSLEDFRVTITLTGTPSSGTRYVMTIPDSSTEGVLYQYVNGVRGRLILDPGTKVTDSQGRVIFKPARDQFGDPLTVFNYVLGDGASNSTQADVKMVVQPINDPPVAESATIELEEDGLGVQQYVHLQLNGSDPDGDSVVFRVQPPSKGSLHQYDPFDVNRVGALISSTSYVTDSLNRVTYLPVIGEVGRPYTTIVVEGEDGLLASNVPAEIVVNVLLNEKPIAIGANATTDEDVPVLISMNATTQSGNPSASTLELIQAVITKLPENGKIFVVDSNLEASAQIQSTPGNVLSANRTVMYVPNPDGYGVNFDSFKFKVNNGKQESDNEETVWVTVNPVNDPPVAIDVDALQQTNNEMIIRLDGSDVDGDEITAYITTLPVKGSLRQLGGDAIEAGDKVENELLRLIYTPDPVDKYTETFEFRVYDNQSFSVDVGVASVSVGGVNERPFVYNISATIDEDTEVLLTLNGTDPDSNSWTAVITRLPRYGLLYQVNTFGFQADAIPVENLAVTDNLHRVMYVPTCNPEANPSATCYRHPTSNLPIGTDGNGLPVYDTFEYKSTDGQGADSLETALGIIGVRPVNDAPRVSTVTEVLLEDTNVTFALPVIDVDDVIADVSANVTLLPKSGDLLQYDGTPITAVPTAVTDSQLRLTYVPPPDQHGVASKSFIYAFMQFTTRDPLNVTEDVGVVRFEVQPDADLPVVYDANATVTENVARVINLQGVDVDGDVWTAVIWSLPTQGKLYQVTAAGEQDQFIPTVGASVVDTLTHRVMYVPDADVEGPATDSFSYRARDSPTRLSVETATVDIFITAVNDAPDAQSFTVDTDEDVPLAFELLVSDAENDTLSVSVTKLPSKGQLYQLHANGSRGDAFTVTPTVVTHPGRQVWFEPSPEEHGDAPSFIYTELEFLGDDGKNVSEQVGVVRIQVNPINDGPVAQPLSFVYCTEDVPLRIDLNDFVVDPDVASFGDVLHGKITAMPSSGNLYQFNSKETGKKGDIITGAPSPLTVPNPLIPDTKDANPMVFWYEPPLDESGANFTQVRFTVSDNPESGPSLVSLEAVIDITVLSTNDEPTAQDSEYTYGLNGDVLNISLIELVNDVDFGDIMSFVLVDPLAKGRLYLDEDLTTEVEVDTPYLVGVWYLHHNDQGSQYPYGSFTYRAWDGNSPLNSTCAACEGTITVDVLCPAGEVNHVWSNTGGVCNTCPEGASCSSEGTSQPTSRPGYYRSADEDDLLLGFVACQPAEACAGGVSSNTQEQCTDAYDERLCGQCADGYYRLDNECKSCPSDKIFYLIVVGVPIALVFMYAMVYVARRGIDLAFLSISLNFVQILAVFAEFRLNWPRSVSTFFTSLSIFHLNLDLFSLDCDISGLEYYHKWWIFMGIPPFMFILLLIGYGVYGIFTALRYQCQCSADSRLEAYRSGDAEQHEHNRGCRTDCNWGWGIVVRAFTIFLLIAYLPIVVKAFQILDCTDQVDGSSTLDARPDLSCDDDWWSDIYPVAVIFVFLYGLGIPAWFVFVLFAARPPMPGGRKWWFFNLPPKKESDVEVDILGKAVKDRRAADLAAKSLGDEKDGGGVSTDDEASASEEVVEQMGGWQFKYQSLSNQFDPHYFYWSLIVVLRKFLIGVSSVLLTAQPMYQGTLALMTLFFMSLIQLKYKPFRRGTGMNRLEFTQLVVLCVVLFIGFLFYGEQDTTVDTTIALTGLVFIVSSIVFLMIAFLFLDQVCAHFGWRFCGCLRKKRRKSFEEEDDDEYERFAQEFEEPRPLSRSSEFIHFSMGDIPGKPGGDEVADVDEAVVDPGDEKAGDALFEAIDSDDSD